MLSFESFRNSITEIITEYQFQKWKLANGIVIRIRNEYYINGDYSHSYKNFKSAAKHLYKKYLRNELRK